MIDCLSPPKPLLHLHHILLLRRLRFVGFLQDLSHQLLGFQVLGDAAIRARHFTEGQIGFAVFATGAFLKARRGDFVEEVLEGGVVRGMMMQW